MRSALLLAGKDLRRRIRDRSAILVAIILPLVLAGVFSLTIGDAAEGAIDVTFAVVDADHTDVSGGLGEILRQIDFVTVRDVADVAAAEDLADRGEVDAAFVIPAGFGAGVSSGQGGELAVVASPESGIGALIAVSIARSFASRLDSVGVAVGVAAPPGAGPAELATLAQRAQRVAPAAVLDAAATNDRVYGATTFFAIGMAVFFLFFTVDFGIRGLLEEREERTLARLLVAPVRPQTILAGKGIAAYAVGFVSTTFLVITTTRLLDAQWGDALGVALLVIVGVFAAVTVTSLVGTYAKTASQAGSYGSIVAVVGGLLGGTFFPISQAPGMLAYLRFLVPQGWLMAGFQELASGGSVLDAMPAIAGTALIGCACAAVAWIRAFRLVEA